MQIEYSKKAAKYINELDKPTKQRMKKAIEGLTEQPPKKREQNFALEFIKKLVLAWDPDYTKVTDAERMDLEQAEKEIENHDTISHNAINWD